jgi:hydrogenase maturation protease
LGLFDDFGFQISDFAFRISPVSTLIIGYGNQSRRDDGVGWFVIQQLAALNLSGVELETAHQLEVEAAETISRFDRVIFVDAAIPEAPQAVQCSEVTPNFQSHAVAHYLTPADVLSLCQTLYHRQPKAVLYSIRGKDFNFGTTLTPEVEQAAREVVKQIVNSLNPPSPSGMGDGSLNR